MPDGTIIKNVPEGTTKQQLLQRLGQMPAPPVASDITAMPDLQGDTQAPPQEGSRVTVDIPRSIMDQPATGKPEAPPFMAIDDPSFHQAFGRAFLKRVLDNAGAIPGQIIANAAPRGEAVTPMTTPSLFGPVTGNAMELAASLVNNIFGTDVSSQAQEGKKTLDQMLTGENALAALRVPGQAVNAITGQPSQNFGQLQGTEAAITRKFEEKAPVATGAGGVFGDIATLAAGRKAIRANDPGVQAALERALPAFNQRADTVVLRALQTVGNVARKTGFRAARTATEAAFLASLQNQDLSKAGATAGGTQVLSDAGAAMFRGMRHVGLLKAVGTAALIKLGIDQFTPGGLDRILPNIEGANKEVILATLIGGAGALLLGDTPKGLFGPSAAAFLDVIKRGGVISLLNSWVRDPVRVGPIIKKFSEDPDYFGQKARTLLERSINSENIDIRTTIDNLMKDKAFKKKFEALNNETVHELGDGTRIREIH